MHCLCIFHTVATIFIWGSFSLNLFKGWIFLILCSVNYSPKVSYLIIGASNCTETVFQFHSVFLNMFMHFACGVAWALHFVEYVILFGASYFVQQWLSFLYITFCRLTQFGTYKVRHLKCVTFLLISHRNVNQKQLFDLCRRHLQIL